MTGAKEEKEGKSRKQAEQRQWVVPRPHRLVPVHGHEREQDNGYPSQTRVKDAGYAPPERNESQSKGAGRDRCPSHTTRAIGEGKQYTKKYRKEGADDAGQDACTGKLTGPIDGGRKRRRIPREQYRQQPHNHHAKTEAEEQEKVS